MKNGIKITLLFVGLTVKSTGFAQNSYYFASPIPSEENEVSISKQFYGNYESKDGSMVYECTKEGVFAVSISMSSISRETIRESSKFDVRGGFLIGVIENDSVPCVEDGDYYLFGVKNRIQIAGEGSENVLVKVDNRNYVLNYLEGERYLPVKLRFEKNKLEISDFDYEVEGDAFPFIAEKESISGEQTTIILNPSSDEYEQLESVAFVPRPLYKRAR